MIKKLLMGGVAVLALLAGFVGYFSWKPGSGDDGRPGAGQPQYFPDPRGEEDPWTKSQSMANDLGASLLYYHTHGYTLPDGQVIRDLQIAPSDETIGGGDVSTDQPPPDP